MANRPDEAERDWERGGWRREARYGRDGGPGHEERWGPGEWTGRGEWSPGRREEEWRRGEGGRAEWGHEGGYLGGYGSPEGVWRGERAREHGAREGEWNRPGREGEWGRGRWSEGERRYGIGREGWGVRAEGWDREGADRDADWGRSGWSGPGRYGHERDWGRMGSAEWGRQDWPWRGGEETGRRGYESGTYIGRGPKNYRRSDQRIEEDLCERLTEHPRIDASDIEVKVQNAEVTLSGAVNEREAKRMAEDVAENVSGVREVHNNIHVHREASPLRVESRQEGPPPQRRAG